MSASRKLCSTIFLLTGFLFSACATYSSEMTGSHAGALYPPGVYQHSVHLEFANPKTGATQSMSLKGIVTLKPDGTVNMVGLSPFNSTVFRLTDASHGEPKIELYEERLKPIVPSLMKRYALIKRVLLQKRENLNKTLQDEDGQNVEVTVDNYDKDGVPRRIAIAAANYKVQIEVTEYDLQKNN